MRLFDAIMHSPTRMPLLWDAEANVVDKVRDATPRYVLDGHASRACEDLIRDVPELFDPDNPLLRVPAQSFWFESHYYEPDPGVQRRARMGILIEAAADGRSGWTQQFGELEDGSWRAVPIANEFDLDAPPSTDGKHAYSLRHSGLRHIDSMLRHIVLHPDPAYFARYGPVERQTEIARMAEAAWFDVPLILAFAAMLASPGIVESRPSDLARLNRARAKGRKQPLLDHIEVSLVLGAASASNNGGSGAARRSTPRLHYVRGHVVNRRGRVFWRSPHLRGDTTRALVQRNVRVTTASARSK